MIATIEKDPSGGASSSPPRVVIREFGTWKILASFETISPASSLVFDAGSDRLATSTINGWIQLWDLKTRREISRTRATDGLAFGTEFSSDGTWLAVSAVDRVGRLYDVSGAQMKLIKTIPDAGWLAISPDKSHLAASYFSLRVYDTATYDDVPTARSGLEITNGVDVLSKKTLARARQGDKVYELNPLTGESHEITWLPGKLRSLPESDESWGLVQHDDSTLEVMDFDSHQSVMKLPKEAQSAVVVRQFAGGSRAVLLYPDKMFEIWNVTTGQLLKQIHIASWVNGIKPSPDGRWLAVSLVGEALSLWDTTTWAERPFKRSGGAVTDITFSRDGSRLLATVPDNDNAEEFDVRSGRLIGKLVGHSQSVLDAAFSPDGRRIVTASADTTVRIWDAATLRELASFSGHKRPVIRARFTDDGNAIVSIDNQGNARMWLTKAFKK
jgi:WD40 repeat protein